MIRDLAIAVRVLLRRPRASLFIVLVLALGIGLSTAMFSVLDGVLLRGLPFPDGDRFVTLNTLGPSGGPMPAEDFRFLEREQEVLTEVAAFRTYNSVVTREGEGSKGLTATYVTGNLFPMLGVEPVLGRNFSPLDQDPTAPSVAILSHRVWQGQFGGDPAVLGRSILLNREPMTVVGVMPEGFLFPVRQEAWAVLRWEGRAWSDAGVFAIGKRPPGLSPDAATERLQPLMPSLDAAHPRDEARRFLAVDYVRAITPAAIQTSLKFLLLAVLGVLLLAAINAANLRLADALTRQQDLVVRRALGGRTVQLLRHLMAESLLLVGAGTLAGLALGWTLTRVVAERFLQGSGLVRLFWIDVRYDLRTWAFAVAVAALVVAVSGLIPALWALRRPELRPESRSTRGPGTLRLIRSMVTAEVALCFALVVASGLLVRSGASLLSQAPGFEGSRILSTLVNTYQADWQTPEETRAFWGEVLPRLAARPEIEAVTLADSAPWEVVQPLPVRVDLRDERPPGELPRAAVRAVRPGFFETLHWPLSAGRGFEKNDARDSAPGDEVPVATPVPAVITASFARRHFQGDALGRTFEVAPAFQGEAPRLVIVVGVATDAGLAPPDRPDAEDAVFLPLSFAEHRGGFLLLRGRPSAGPGTWMRAVDEEIGRSDPRVATLDPQTYSDARAEALWVERRLAELFTFFALAALLLSAIGLFGVVELSVRHRRRELAIRSALGARPGQLRRRLLVEGGLCVVLGLGFGALLMGLAQGTLRTFLHGIEPWDPAILGATATATVLGLLLATLGPAHRAAQTDPAKTLNSE